MTPECGTPRPAARSPCTGPAPGLDVPRGLVDARTKIVHGRLDERLAQPLADLLGQPRHPACAPGLPSLTQAR